MATDCETMLLQVEKIKHDFKEFYIKVTSDLNNLSIQLEGIKLGQQADKESDKAPLRTCGYVNWNKSHDILKTEKWKRMSVFTEACGSIERGLKINVYSYCNMDTFEVVNEKKRFPKDNLYVNLNDPLINAEILYIIEQRASEPVVGLLNKFLSVAREDMHTYSSFEKKYGLIWVDPLPEASNVTET